MEEFISNNTYLINIVIAVLVAILSYFFRTSYESLRRDNADLKNMIIEVRADIAQIKTDVAVNHAKDEAIVLRINRLEEKVA